MLLTGGYGSALQACSAALIVAMATLGILFARWESHWRFMFLGVNCDWRCSPNAGAIRRGEAVRRMIT